MEFIVCVILATLILPCFVFVLTQLVMLHRSAPVHVLFVPLFFLLAMPVCLQLTCVAEQVWPKHTELILLAQNLLICNAFGQLFILLREIVFFE